MNTRQFCLVASGQQLYFEFVEPCVKLPMACFCFIVECEPFWNEVTIAVVRIFMLINRHYWFSYQISLEISRKQQQQNGLHLAQPPPYLPAWDSFCSIIIPNRRSHYVSSNGQSWHVTRLISWKILCCCHNPLSMNLSPVSTHHTLGFGHQGHLERVKLFPSFLWLFCVVPYTGFIHLRHLPVKVSMQVLE